MIRLLRTLVIWAANTIFLPIFLILLFAHLVAWVTVCKCSKEGWRNMIRTVDKTFGKLHERQTCWINK